MKLGPFGKHRHEVLPTVVLIAAVVLVWVYRTALIDWFGGQRAEERPSPHEHAPGAALFELGVG